MHTLNVLAESLFVLFDHLWLRLSNTSFYPGSGLSEWPYWAPFLQWQERSLHLIGFNFRLSLKWETSSWDPVKGTQIWASAFTAERNSWGRRSILQGRWLSEPGWSDLPSTATQHGLREISSAPWEPSNPGAWSWRCFPFCGENKQQ